MKTNIVNLRPEDHLGNEALRLPTWKKGKILKFVVLEPKDRNSEHFPFIDTMNFYIGTTTTFVAIDRMKDWWRSNDVGFYWHTSWLSES